MNRQASGGGRPTGGPRGPMGGPWHMSMKHEKPKNASATLARLWLYLRRQAWGLVVVTALVAVNTLLSVLGPYLMGRAIDTYIDKGDLPGLWHILSIMAGVYLITSVGTWLQEFLVAGVAQRAVRDMREDLFTRLQTLSLRFFDQNAHGELMSRLTNDVDNVSMVLSQGATGFIRSVLSLIFVAIMMFVVNVGLALVSLVTLPMVALVTRWLSERTRQGFRDQQESLGILNGLIEETITGQHVVQAYGREQQAIDDFDKANQTLRRAAIRAQIFGGLGGPLINFVNNLGRTIVVAAGG